MTVQSNKLTSEHIEMTKTHNSIKNKVTFGVLSLIVFLTVFYGLLAIDMGRVNSLPIFDNSILEKRLDTVEKSQIEPNFKAGAEEAKHSGIWLMLMGYLTSEKYTYDGDKGVYTAFLYYAKMSNIQMSVLSIHNVLAGTCIIIGGMQFFPRIRQKAPKLHKRIGKTYVGLVVIAMTMAIIYLLLTPSQDIFSGLLFAFGLWVLAVLVLFSLAMSIYYIKKKQIAQHQAYMALNYCLLLSAPLLRLDWTLMGIFLPIDAALIEANFSILIWLLPHCVLTAFMVLCLNRWVQNESKTTKSSKFSEQLILLVNTTQKWWPAIASVCVLTITYQYLYLLLDNGQKSAGISVLPQTFIDYETSILKPLLFARILLVLTCSITFFTGAYALQRLFDTNNQDVNMYPKSLLIMYSFGLCTYGFVLFYLGYFMGVPSWKAIGGGTFYIMVSILSILFGGLLLMNLKLDRGAHIRECAVFGYAAAISLPLYYLNLAILALFGISDSNIAFGHGYEIAAMAAPFGFIFAYLYAVYGKGTNTKLAR